MSSSPATSAIMKAFFTMALVVSLPGVIYSFNPLISFNGKSATHSDITQRAALRKTAEVCRDIAVSAGRDFSLTIDDSVSFLAVQRACSSTGSSTSLHSTIIFVASIADMYLSNALVDIVFALSEKHHFDDESFRGGRDVITTGVAAVKASVRLGNFDAGRLTLGTVFHTLQDFYSHSNWVELGNMAPYSTLITPDKPLQNLAALTTPTCRSCSGGSCATNLLPQGLLTSGYFNVFSADKPAGKCSHGGSLDRTSTHDPVGGINKDTVESNHGSLHQKAADLAVEATLELLEDIRLAVGDQDFLRLMGLPQAPVLCFVIDTTGSMSDDIAEVRRVSFQIIESKRGTPQEPPAYILVPFNDPDFGPLFMTTNADVLKDRINKLTAIGGGDTPEFSLSGLQLALTAAPRSSEIFLFTDAPAKDAYLKNTITALIQSSKSVVNFMITNVLTGLRRRRSSQGVVSRAMSDPDGKVYRDLAQASGGQVIVVSKAELSFATQVIRDSLATAVVTVFQVVRNPGRPDRFTFTVDGSLRNMTAYITRTSSSSLTFSLTSSTGVTQNSGQSSGPLASFSKVGNLHRLFINTDNQTGLWEIRVDSNDPYSVKVTGQSSINFIFNLVEADEGGRGDFSLKEGRPLSGGNATLLVSVTESDTIKVTEVTMLDSSGTTEVNGSLQSVGRGGNYLVTFSGIPAGDFMVRLRGEDNSSTSTQRSFQRQASTQISTSSLSVIAQANNTNIEPGATISVPFTVAATVNGVVNDSATEIFTIQANNDRGYSLTAPSTVTIAAGIAHGTVTLTAPADAASGTDVTLTIAAENTGAIDINYAVLRLFVVAKVTDITRPVCQVVSSTICPSSPALCTSSQWEFIANFTDGFNGTGIESLTIRQGNGTLNTSTAAGAAGENVTVASYSASCCSQNVVLAAVDRVGNVGTCVGQARESTTVTPVTPVPTAALNTTSAGRHTESFSLYIFLGVAFSILWK